MQDRSKISRSGWLKTMAATPIAIGAFAALSREAKAKSPKSAFKYVDHPVGGKQCSGCKLFIPGKTPSSNGGCKVVDGSISPKGYCIAWTKR